MGDVIEVTAVFGEGVGWHIHPMAYWPDGSKAQMMSVLDGVCQRLKNLGFGLVSVKIFD